jgi:hypothetical protein
VAIAGSTPALKLWGEGIFFYEAKTLHSEMTAFLAAMEADSVQFCPFGQTECLDQHDN